MLSCIAELCVCLKLGMSVLQKGLSHCLTADTKQKLFSKGKLLLKPSSGFCNDYRKLSVRLLIQKTFKVLYFINSIPRKTKLDVTSYHVSLLANLNYLFLPGIKLQNFLSACDTF